jgi:hypothetical protein
MKRQENEEAGPPLREVLTDYALAYLRGYLAAVEDEVPEHTPLFYNERPYKIEACCMPNSSYCFLFEKSDKPTIEVTEQDWGYVVSQVMSGITYTATVYSHEGLSEEDAEARGKKDAIRDIRALESSNIADSARQLEKLIEELNDIHKWSKNPVKMAKYAVSRLEPIRQSILNSGVDVDMMTMIETAKRYPPAPTQVVLDSDGFKLFEDVLLKLDDLDQIAKCVETQEKEIREIELSVSREVHDFKSDLDKKMAKGLSVIMTTMDRKIDKALGAFSGKGEELESIQQMVAELQEAGGSDPRFDDLAEEFEGLKAEVEDVRKKLAEMPKGAGEPIIDKPSSDELASIEKSVQGLSLRVKRIEDYLRALSSARKKQ